MQWVGVLLLGVAGFLVGGVYTTWKNSRGLAVALGAGALLAAGGGVAWLIG